MPGISGFDVLDRVHAIDPTIVTVVITGFATVSSAVDAMKKGAYDFLPKPFTPDEFRLITHRGIERRKLVLETIALRKEKELLREQFASIVSHEMKAPLGAIQQNLFALDMELADILTDQQKQKLERIKVRIDELLKIINSWLRVISVDVNKLRENFQAISVKEPLLKALESVETYATRKNIEIVLDVKDPLALISGDSLSMSEIFVNIIGNAIKYSPINSRIKIKAEDNDHEVLILVQDAGVGISEEDLPHIFEGFYRGKSDPSIAGHGIGLAVSHHLVDAHNGSISVESEVGKGTSFMISFPIV
jgi:signal transduction histidine kinase